MFDQIYKGKRILVTGDTGFKGSWLCLWLKELGADVYGYALPPQGAQDNYVTCHVAKLIHHQDGDIRDYQNFFKYVNGIKPDIAFHLAAQPLVRESYHSPRETFETNVMGAVNFFEAVRNTKSIKAAINITTDKCYRNNDDGREYREDDALGGRDPYSASKSGSEIVTYSYLKSFFLDSGCLIASARAGNVVGGGDWSQDRIIPDLFRAVAKGQILQIRHPNAIRPWQHVLEPLSGYLLLAAGLYRQKQDWSGSWNFGPLSQGHLKVIELVEGIYKTLGHGEYSVDRGHHVHEDQCLKLDISKAINELNWKPILSLPETIEFIVEGYEVELKGGDIYQNRLQQIAQFSKKAKLGVYAKTSI